MIWDFRSLLRIEFYKFVFCETEVLVWLQLLSVKYSISNCSSYIHAYIHTKYIPFLERKTDGPGSGFGPTEFLSHMAQVSLSS